MDQGKKIINVTNILLEFYYFKIRGLDGRDGIPGEPGNNLFMIILKIT